MRILTILILVLQIVNAQQFEESKLKCSKSNTAKAMLRDYKGPTASQNSYDVSFYDIDIEIGVATKEIFGKVEIEGISLVSSLETVDLDLYSGMKVNSVEDGNGSTLEFTHGLNILTVKLNNPASINNRFNIVVNYEGKPLSVGGFGSFNFGNYPNNSGIPMIATLSEPYGARDWWPCKDIPSDKADSVNISIKVPNNLIVASNGKLVDTEIEDSWKIYHWQERYPIATYLVSIAIHPYTVFYDWYITQSDSMRLEYYVFPDNFDDVQYNYSLTKDMIGAMAERFGEYPFIKEKYGHAEFTWGGGMEHQTLSSMGGHSEALIAHELAHQWWGDMVTCADFNNIWLNEGFATYSEALWYEKKYGAERMHLDMRSNRYFNAGTIYVEDTSNISRIFHGGLSYAKGSWVLHMLRHVIGDEAFFTGLQEYGNQYRFKSATTEQFQVVMEDASGRDLTLFFQRWIYGEYYPEYKVTYSSSNDSLNLLIEQTQSSDIFVMPIDIKANFTDESEQIWVIENNQRTQSYTLQIEPEKEIDRINIDPDNWILHEKIDITLDTTSGLVIPEKFVIYPVYPNPFNSETTIKFNIASDSDVEIRIVDINGKTILINSKKYISGTHNIKWGGVNSNGKKLPSGTYIVEINNGNEIKTQKMLLLK